MSAAINIEITSANSARITGDLSELVRGVKEGKGNVGAILSDTSLFSNIRQTVVKVESISDTLAVVSGNFSALSRKTITGNGNIATFVNDTTLVGNLNAAVVEIRGAANSLDETLALLRESRLLQRYYKRQSKH